MNTDKTEQLGKLIDELDNLAHSLQMPLPADMHVRMMKDIIPEKVNQFKKAFVELTGENPWEFHPENNSQ